VSFEAVRQRRAKLQNLVSMPNDIATYVVAQREGVPIHRFLDTDSLTTVASFDEKLAAKEVGATPAPAPKRSTQRTRRVERPAAVELRLDNVRVPAGVLSAKHMREAERMAKTVYPLLYAFENSAREFIDGYLTATYGPDWWDDPKIVSHNVREAVEISRRAEAENRTHAARNARPIYYTTFGHLVLIVQSEKGAKVFKRPLFPRHTWFPELVKASEHTRNIVAHMNPLQPGDIRRLQVDFEDWLNQIANHLPTVVP
jgi:Swt1-like HEPN